MRLSYVHSISHFSLPSTLLSSPLTFLTNVRYVVSPKSRVRKDYKLRVDLHVIKLPCCNDAAINRESEKTMNYGSTYASH